VGLCPPGKRFASHLDGVETARYGDGGGRGEEIFSAFAVIFQPLNLHKALPTVGGEEGCFPGSGAPCHAADTHCSVLVGTARSRAAALLGWHLLFCEVLGANSPSGDGPGAVQHLQGCGSTQEACLSLHMLTPCFKHM